MTVEREHKPAWHAVPTAMKVAVAERLGTPVVRAVRAYGGYGPSATFLLALADGRRAFFKGTYPLPPDSGVRWALDREEMVFRRLGARLRPWAPQYLGSVKAEGWHGLLLERVDGASVLPWTEGKAGRAARSYARFHGSTVGGRLPSWLPSNQHRHFAIYWGRLADDEEGRERLVALAGQQRADASAWLDRHLAVLTRAERALWRAGRPFALLHFDTRSDNVRLEGDLLRIFDWPYACVGPAEFDVAAFAQSVAAERGPSPDAVINWYEQVLPLRREVLLGAVAGVAGYFADSAPRPDVPGLPRLRFVQRIQLKASVAWAARLLELPEPAWLASIPPAEK
jgi:hypothetical protein